MVGQVKWGQQLSTALIRKVCVMSATAFPKNTSKVWMYYKVHIKLATPQLGTCTSSSIWREHIVAKAKKMIEEANGMSKKVKKTHEKYFGSNISTEKEMNEIRALIRTYQEKLNRIEEVPEDDDAMLKYAEELDKELMALIKAGEEAKSTVFMRHPTSGIPVISSHMIVGNLKENLKIVANNNPSKRAHPFLKSKVSVNEMIRLDARPVEEFLEASEDVVKGKDGKPAIMERPIRFEDNFGKTVTAIALSEYLPAGTEFEFHLQVREDSPWNDLEILEQMFEYGKGNGLGQNRGSGFGRFYYKITKVDYDPVIRPAGGWR